ncbi:MAG: glutamate--tRNA ligase [Oscillospiraceae bacterium]|nr:glutamate--tRNA ligase [Oscillospiraceae bacterium]
MKQIRTRFAPSPTGFMHLGNLRTALYAWLYAKNNAGKFILRVEDTDQSRYVEGAVEVIYQTLKECGITWDEGPDIGGDYAPYIQSERKDAYMKYAEELIEKGHAYYCYCPPENETCDCKNKAEKIKEKKGILDLPEVSFVIRQNIPDTGSTTFKDEIYGEITVENKEIEDQILIKSDGMPTYNFANVIDDHAMNITHIIRGNEYLSSTPKYNLLYQAFGWELPIYIHVPQIMRDATHKLSKRDGDAYFSDFKENGYLTAAIINYIALLGWSPKGSDAEREIFSLGELAEIFGTDGISKSPAIFDIEKMRAINAEHIRRLSSDEFKKVAVPYIGNYPINYDILCAALQPRTEVLSEITPQADFLEKPCEYTPDLYFNKKMKTSPETARDSLEKAVKVLESTESFTKDDLYAKFKETAEQNAQKPGFYLYPLQVALTGKPAAPGGGLDICVMFGKEESVNRIRKAIDLL